MWCYSTLCRFNPTPFLALLRSKVCQEVNIPGVGGRAMCVQTSSGQEDRKVNQAVWTTLRHILAALCLVVAGTCWTASSEHIGGIAQGATPERFAPRHAASSTWMPPSQT